MSKKKHKLKEKENEPTTQSAQSLSSTIPDTQLDLPPAGLTPSGWEDPEEETDIITDDRSE